MLTSQSSLTVRPRETMGGLSGLEHADAVQPVGTFSISTYSLPGHTDTFRHTADGESNSNMTNLAIKGIVGVKAMAEISRALQQNSDPQYYDVRPVLKITLNQSNRQDTAESCRRTCKFVALSGTVE